MTGPSKRDRIFEATVKLLMERGLLSSQTRDVTDQAGVGTGLLNHYFRWPDLRAAAWATIFKGVADDMRRDAETPSQTLDRFFCESFTAQAAPYWRLWIEAESLAVQDLALAKVLGSARLVLRDQLTAILRDGVADGSWSLSDPRATALSLEALRDGLTGLLLVADSELNSARAELLLRETFQRAT